MLDFKVSSGSGLLPTEKADSEFAGAGPFVLPPKIRAGVAMVLGMLCFQCLVLTSSFYKSLMVIVARRVSSSFWSSLLLLQIQYQQQLPAVLLAASYSETFLSPAGRASGSRLCPAGWCPTQVYPDT